MRTRFDKYLKIRGITSKYLLFIRQKFTVYFYKIFLLMPITLYNGIVYANASEECSGFSNPMNVTPWGPDGCDEKVQRLLRVHDANAPGRKDSGICLHMAVCWLIGALNNRSEAKDISEFSGYYKNVLLFQASELLAAHALRNVPNSYQEANEVIHHGDFNLHRFESRQVAIQDVKTEIKVLDESLSASLGAYIQIQPNYHTIAICIDPPDNFYIFDSYGGLFVYNHEAGFYCDVERTLSLMLAHYRLPFSSNLLLQPFCKVKTAIQL